jgi:hypothetical protein
LAVVAAACSGSSSADEGLPPVTLDPTTTSASSTTTTVATTTSSSTTTSTPAPTVPGGKLDLEIPTECDSDLDEIYGRYLLYWDAFLIAMGPPQADPNYPPLAELAGADLHSELILQIERRRDADEVLVDSENSATDHGLRLPNPAVLTKTEGNEVTIQDCFLDAIVGQTVDGQVLDDSVVSDLLNIKMKVIGGEWRVLGIREALPESSGYEECKDYANQFQQ